VWCIVVAKKRKATQEQAYCTQENESAGTCQEMAELGQVSTSTGAYIAGAVIAFILSIVLIVMWLFAYGPMKWASYDACKAKKNFGSQWFWVMPRSGFRKFLCTMFGACECAADGLALDCNMTGVVSEQDFQWREEDAAKSTSPTDQKFCCDKAGLCENPTGQT